MYGFSGFGSVEGAMEVIKELGRGSSGTSVSIVVGAVVEDIMKY